MPLLAETAEFTRLGDVLTEHPNGRAGRIYLVIEIAPGLARTTMTVTAACVTTGQRRALHYILANRIEVCEEPI